MAQVTSPIILDSTGQQIHSDLQQIKTVLTTPSAAEDITFDNTGTGMQADDVQDAITELKSNLTDLGVDVNLLLSLLTDTSIDLRLYNIVGSSYYPLSDLRSKIGTLSRATVFIGLHTYNGTRMYIAYLYGNNNYGGCIYATYDGSVKAQFVNNGTVSTKTFTLTNGG